MPMCCECGLGIWGEVALSSSVGVRTRLLSSLPLLTCVATSRKTPAENKFLECSSALQHLLWHVTPHCLPQTIPSLMPASHHILRTEIACADLEASEIVPVSAAKWKKRHQKNKPKNPNLSLSTNLSKQCSKILENKAFKTYLFGFIFFSPFLGIFS